MPEESDEGANVYRTFHGQASVQVLLRISSVPAFMQTNQNAKQNRETLSGGIGTATHKILQLGREGISITWRERKEEGGEGEEGGGEERDGENWGGEEEGGGREEEERGGDEDGGDAKRRDYDAGGRA